MTISVSEFREREHRNFMSRLTQEVQEIVRQDLIQAVGNALRFHQRSRQELEELEQFAAEQVAQGETWGTF